MKNMKARAWGCVGLMMLGVVFFMSSMAFINNDVMVFVMLLLGIASFLAGIILHYATVRCPHCGSHLGRLYGPLCPFCGQDYNKTDKEQ